MNKNEERDLKILADAFYQELFFNDGFEYGSPMIDFKRPFGNSDVEGDILEMLGIEPEGDDYDRESYSNRQRDYARELYKEKLVPYLKDKWNQINKNHEKNNG